MKITDLVIEIRNSNRQRLAQLTPAESIGLTAVIRFNNVGTWAITLPANNPKADLLRQPGAGLVITGPEGVLMSGPTSSAKLAQTSDNPQGDWIIEGLDDLAILGERLAYPEPGNPDPASQSTAYDEITDLASTVIYHYIDANLGPSAPAAREVSGLTLAADTGLGSSVLGKARFDALGPLVSSIAAIDGLGYSLRQSGDGLIFSVYEPNDLSDVIRLDVENNRLSSSDFIYAAPKATRAIVAGQGQGEARQFVEVSTTESEAAESSWGRRIELFKDQRDSDDPALLTQAGTELLAENGKTLNAFSVKPAENGLMRYGLDWQLGDLVSVVAGNQSVTAIVSEVALSVNQDGVYMLATIGKPATADADSQVAVTQSNQESRISNLERNEPVGGGEGGGGGSIGFYGSFYDMTDQPLASITAAQAVAIGVTAEANGVGRSSGNRITFPNPGTYSLTFSIQLTNYHAGLSKAIVWVRKNGVDYADSATELDMPARKSAGVPNRQVLTINYVATAAANDYVQVYWAGDNTQLQIEALPAGTSPVSPAVPSIILTAVQVGNSGLFVSPTAPTSTGVLWLDTDEPSDIPVPTGGTAGQMLAKIDSTNYNTQWVTPPAVPIGGTTGQVLTKINATDYNANWQTPTTPGLVPIIPTSVTTVGGSASINTTTGVITFTGVTTINVNGAFSSAYNHYKILHVSSGATANTEVNIQMRASGTNYATANQRSHGIYYQSSGGVTIAGGTARTALLLGWTEGAANSMNSHSVDLFNPFNTTRTTYNSTSTSYVSGVIQGGVPTDSSYDGFALITSSTHAGTIEIYGYN